MGVWFCIVILFISILFNCRYRSDSRMLSIQQIELKKNGEREEKR